jgi:Peptidase family M23
MTLCSIRAVLLLCAYFGLLSRIGDPYKVNAAEKEDMTPLLLSVTDAPAPFSGSDQRTHLAYELWITNFSSGEASIETVEVLEDGSVLHKMDTAEIARRLQPAGMRHSTGVQPKSSQALLFIHFTLAPGASVPHQLTHRVRARFTAAPPGHQELTEEGGTVSIDARPILRIGPPLAGENYISADSCCDATRHTRAALPVNGRVWLAQRYAVDWEQLDKEHRIYSGPREKPESYAIFGKPVLAVGDATVVSITENQPEQTPGKFPTDISLDAADGNSVILDLGEGHYALYAHMQPGSIKVQPNEKVKRGQLLGLVGNTGNSVAPHLHFQLMDGPSSLASNGLPYEIDGFQVTGKTPGTEAFDHAEETGIPLAITPISPPQSVSDGLPLDQLVIAFPARP